MRRVARRAWQARWWIAWACAYLALGAWLMFHVDLLVLDAMSRAAHAFFVWHDDPNKLAAIGFAWPPLLTLPLLALTWFEPFGRTGYSAVVVSAVTAGAVLALVRGTLRRAGIRTGVAVALVLGLALNPMFAFYAANGMSEMAAITLPALALAACLRHFETRSIESLGLAGLAAAAGVMTRYELAAITPLVLLAGVAAIPRSERTANHVRAVLLYTVAPTAIAVALWMFFNWTIQGSPTWFLSSGNQLGTITGTATTVGAESREVPMGIAVQQAMLAQACFAPLALVLGVWLLARAAAPGAPRLPRLQLLVVAGFLLYNLVTNLVLVVGADNPWFAQPRFNMRAMAVGVLGLAWLVARAPAARARARLTAFGVAVVVAAVPASGWMMWGGSILPSFGEKAFLMSFGGEDLRGREIKGIRVGCTGARRMADWIAENVEGRQSIIADDSSLYAVMMFSGRPDLFLDRVDYGESFFLHALDAPPPGTKYILSTNFDECAGVGDDLLSAEYPDMYADGGYAPLGPLTRVAHREHGLVLRELPPFEPIPESGPPEDP